MRNILVNIGKRRLNRTIRKSTNKELLETAMSLMGKERNNWEEISLSMIRYEMKERNM